MDSLSLPSRNVCIEDWLGRVASEGKSVGGTGRKVPSFIVVEYFAPSAVGCKCRCSKLVTS